MTDTLIRHRACGVLVFRVLGGLRQGDPIEADRWMPLHPDWPRPRDGDRTVCPNCGDGFIPSDLDLERLPA